KHYTARRSGGNRRHERIIRQRYCRVGAAYNAFFLLHERKFCQSIGHREMIINTGGRTDTVQYYTEWLLRRFSEGYVLSRNPLFPNKVTRYELSPDKVDCVVFCSKNYKPIVPRLHEITDRFPTYFHYTITAYGPDIEPGVPSVEES